MTPGRSGETKRVHRFLKAKFASMAFFTKQDMRMAVSPGRGFPTYWSKRILPLLIESGKGRFRVSEYFRKLIDPEAFAKHFSEAARVTVAYEKAVRDFQSFRFLLPLADELVLKDSLDALFYSDRILRRLGIVERAELERVFPKASREGESRYRARIAAEIADWFGGYSVHNVNGRFRGGALMAFEAAAALTRRTGRKYLIDETTAVIEFFIPIEAGSGPDREGRLKAQAERIRWVFLELFVAAILESVNGEAEIWLIESGIENRLYSWTRK